MKGSKIIATIIVALIIAFPAFAQFSGSLWFPNSSDQLQPVDDWGLRIPALVGDGCLQVDSNGVFSVTTCGGTAGSGQFSTTTWGIYYNSGDVVIGNTATNTSSFWYN